MRANPLALLVKVNGLSVEANFVERQVSLIVDLVGHVQIEVLSQADGG